MKGWLKRLTSVLSDTDTTTGVYNPAERIPPGGAVDGRFATHNPPPIGGAVKFLMGAEPTVEEFEETFRQGLIGPWIGAADEQGDTVERVTFHPDHTGETLVADSGGHLLERCLFEWQELGDWSIRMRPVAWLSADENMAAEDRDDSETADEAQDDGETDQWEEERAELVEPEPGEWESIEYGFYAPEAESADADIALFRADEYGFSSACRRGTGPLTADWDAIREFMNSRLLKPVDIGQETLVTPASQAAQPSQTTDALLRPAETTASDT